MAAIATMAMLKPKSLADPSHVTSTRPTPARSISLLSLHHLPKNLASSNCAISTTAVAGAVFSALSNADAAFAAQQIADIAEGDNRLLALLLPLVPAVLWVLYNILQPALNQLNRMRSEKAVIVGLGVGSGLAAAGLLSPPHASADEITSLAAAAAEGGSDSRGLLLLFVVAPAIAWVLYNILQPALNQLNRMRSG